MSENNEMEKNVRPKREEHNHLEVFGGIFPSRLEAEEFFTLEEGIPRRFLRELYLREEFTGSIETVFFDKNPTGRRSCSPVSPMGSESSRFCGISLRIS